MWLLGKLRESIPPELSGSLGLTDAISAKASLSSKLHCNVMTPEKIPGFFIPPRLSRCSATGAPSVRVQPDSHRVCPVGSRDVSPQPQQRAVGTENADRGTSKPGVGLPIMLAHSGDYYGMAGLYESPNTRRKESLFHSSLRGYSLERSQYRPPSRLPALSGQGSTDSDTPSSSDDSSPQSSPMLTRSVSLDLLHCQARLQRDHVLPLLGRGHVRLSAEHDPTTAILRVRVVSVEDLHDGDPDGRRVHCCVSVCLTPGKHQRQNSATVRNCRNPIFNEDFFFTELSEDCLHRLSLRLKVLDKFSSLRRDVVLGVISKPLFQLLLL